MYQVWTVSDAVCHVSGPSDYIQAAYPALPVSQQTSKYETWLWLRPQTVAENLKNFCASISFLSIPKSSVLFTQHCPVDGTMITGLYVHVFAT